MPCVKAAVWRRFGAPPRIEDVSLAGPAAGEVLVDVRACAVCHSDLLAAAGAWGGELPAIYGHEAAGVVAAVGAGVDDLAPGTHVVVTLMRACGACFHCTRGDRVLCETSFALDAPSALRAADGEPIVQGLRTGAFAEQVVVHRSQVEPIEPDIAAPVAALLGCGVITGAGAAINVAGLRPGASAAVIGTGGVGLNAVQGAAVAGAWPIVAIDPVAAKRAAALRFGASHAFAPEGDDLGDRIRALTDGRGPDVVLVCAGVRSAIEQGIGLMRRGGTTVIVGMPPSGVLAEFDPGWLAGDGQRIVGSKMGSARLPADIPALVALYRAGRLRLDELVSATYPLDRIDAAFAAAADPDTLRVVVTIGE